MGAARYSIDKIFDDYVIITDTGHSYTKSVTNDAEAVVQELLAEFGNRRFLYYDSDGDLGELVHNGKYFVTFGFPQDMRGSLK